MSLSQISMLCLLAVMTFYSCEKDPSNNEDKDPICLSDRYVAQVFDETETSTVKYGSNFGVTGIKQDLFMDIYTPKGDTVDNRPAIVLAFGGSFVLGNRQQLKDICIDLAKRGYVAVSIDYRLLSITSFPLDSVKGLDIAVKAATDMKAAIRHLKKDAATSNIYKINPDKIIVGGISAGAITAIQCAYFDDTDNIEPHIQQIIEKNGGVEGNSGDAENLKYSSKVAGVLNLSGAVYRPYFIDSQEPIIASYHGDNDDVVPYNYGWAMPSGIKVIPLYGSKEIETRMKQLNIQNVLVTVPGGGHDLYSPGLVDASFTVFTEQALSLFKENIICK